MKFPAGERKKKREFLGPPPFGPNPSFGPTPFLGSAPTPLHPSGPPPLRAPTPPGPHPFGPPLFRAPTTHRPTRPPPRKKKLAKCGLAKFGQTKFGHIRLAKCGQSNLAKCGIGQIRFGQMWSRPHTTARQPKRSHFSKNTNKIQRKDPQEREERTKIVMGEEKSAKFGHHPSGPHPTFRGVDPSGHHPSGTHPSGHPHFPGFGDPTLPPQGFTTEHQSQCSRFSWVRPRYGCSSPLGPPSPLHPFSGIFRSISGRYPFEVSFPFFVASIFFCFLFRFFLIGFFSCFCFSGVLFRTHVMTSKVITKIIHVEIVRIVKNVPKMDMWVLLWSRTTKTKKEQRKNKEKQ